jgi:hypothetical protein
MGIRIDTLNPGDTVLLDFGKDAGPDEEAVFMRIIGEGDNRRAEFVSMDTSGPAPSLYVWQAYRYNGRWAYGTSADPLRLVRVTLPSDGALHR